MYRWSDKFNWDEMDGKIFMTSQHRPYPIYITLDIANLVPYVDRTWHNNFVYLTGKAKPPL